MKRQHTTGCGWRWGVGQEIAHNRVGVRWGVGQETAHNRVVGSVEGKTAHNRVGVEVGGRASDGTQQGGGGMGWG